MVLAYAADSSWSANKLTVDETGGVVVITYPVPGKSVVWFSIGMQVLTALVQLAYAPMLIWMWVRMFHLFKNAGSLRLHAIQMPAEFWIVIVLHMCVALGWTFAAAHSLTKYLRWGQVPRTLTATSNGLTLRWLGVRQMRERTWGPSDIKRIDLLAERDILLRKRVHRVRIRFRSMFRISLYIPSKGSEHASKIHSALCRVLPVSAGTIPPTMPIE